MVTRRLLLLLVALFLLTLLWRLPARWVSAALPDDVACEQPGGTVWDGSCAALHVGGLQFRGLHWQLIPGQLLHGKLGAQLQLDDAEIHGSCQLLVGRGGRLQLHDLLAELPLSNHLFPAPTAGWSGQLALNLPMLQWQAQQLTALRGSVQLHDLQQLQPRIEFGSYELVLDDTAPRQDRIVGSVHDTSAPLRLAGELQFTLRGAYEFNGSVAPNGTTSAELQQVLDSLGNPDAEGNRTVSVAGSL